MQLSDDIATPDVGMMLQSNTFGSGMHSEQQVCIKVAAMHMWLMVMSPLVYITEFGQVKSSIRQLACTSGEPDAHYTTCAQLQQFAAHVTTAAQVTVT